jgi:hypothetical protein
MAVNIIAVLPMEPVGILVKRTIEPNRQVTDRINPAFRILSRLPEDISFGQWLFFLLPLMVNSSLLCLNQR